MILIKCKRGNADREAPEISDSLINTELQAVARGKRFLDDPDQGGYYVTLPVSIKVSGYNPDVLPGAILSITDQKIGYSGKNIRVESVSIDFKKDSVITNVSGRVFNEPV